MSIAADSKRETSAAPAEAALAARERLSGADTFWLRLDRPTNLMMIHGVMLFDAPLEFARVRDAFASIDAHRTAPMRLGSGSPGGSPSRTTPVSATAPTSGTLSSGSELRLSFSGKHTRSRSTATRKENIMSMLDWNTYRQQVVAGVGDVAKLSPETVKGYIGLSGASQKTARLGAKVNELIALAVAGSDVLFASAFYATGTPESPWQVPAWSEISERYDADRDGVVRIADVPTDVRVMLRPEVSTKTDGSSLSLQRVLQLGAVIGAAGLAYLLALFAQGFRLRELRAS